MVKRRRNVNVFLSDEAREKLQLVKVLLQMQQPGKSTPSLDDAIEFLCHIVPIRDLIAAENNQTPTDHREDHNEKATPAEPSAHNRDLVPAARRQRNKAERPKAPKE